MKKNYLKLLFVVICSGILLFSGCSSSSGSMRYDKEKEDDQNESPVRFSSEESFSLTTDSLDSNYYLTDEDDIDDLPEEEPVIDLSSVMSRFSSENTGKDISADKSSQQEKILMEIIKYLNTPYKYGGTTKNGIDCSAFTQTIFSNTLDIPLLRTARDQYTMGIVIADKEDLEFGDLIFFNTRRRVRPGHVGIYIGDNLFAHASTKHGVIVSSLDHEYYSKRFMGGRRIDGKLNARL